MKAGLSQSTQLKQELKINPRLYQAMDLLYMPLLDLQNHLKQELLNNPFLDMVEDEEEDDAEGETPQEEQNQETEAEKEEKGRRFHRVERYYGQFERSFTIPDDAEANDVRAEFKDGVLRVHLAKSEKARPKQIEVKVS